MHGAAGGVGLVQRGGRAKYQNLRFSSGDNFGRLLGASWSEAGWQESLAYIFIRLKLPQFTLLITFFFEKRQILPITYGSVLILKRY